MPRLRKGAQPYGGKRAARSLRRSASRFFFLFRFPCRSEAVDLERAGRALIGSERRALDDLGHDLGVLPAHGDDPQGLAVTDHGAGRLMVTSTIPLGCAVSPPDRRRMSTATTTSAEPSVAASISSDSTSPAVITASYGNTP